MEKKHDTIKQAKSVVFISEGRNSQSEASQQDFDFQAIWLEKQVSPSGKWVKLYTIFRKGAEL